MTADSIRMLISNRTIDRIFLIANSFVVSQDSLAHFNQIKGRTMTAIFKDKAIAHVDVQGNGESLYYALQEVKSDTLKGPKNPSAIMMGMNKIICSNMKINFRDGKVNNISFYIMPDASFIPPQELEEGDKKLSGFIWREKEKPERKDVVKARNRP